MRRKESSQQKEREENKDRLAKASQLGKEVKRDGCRQVTEEDVSIENEGTNE